MVHGLIKKVLPNTQRHAALLHARAAFLVSRFLGSFEGREGMNDKLSTFFVKPDDLKPATLSRRSSGKQPGRGTCLSGAALKEGAIAQLRWQRHKSAPCAYVYLVKKETKVNASAVSASIDACPFFSQCTWHAVRVHHRSRLLFAPESACERLGSYMHQLWSSAMGLAPGPLIDCVLLKQAHIACTGAPRDEEMIQEIADALLPLMRAPARMSVKVGNVQQIAQAQLALKTSGRSLHMDHDLLPEIAGGRSRAALRQARRDRRTESLPQDLPDVIRSSVQEAFQNGKGLAKPLPVCVKQLQPHEKGATYSVQHATLKSWVSSEAGQEWQKQRSHLYKADNPLGEEVAGDKV